MPEQSLDTAKGPIERTLSDGETSFADGRYRTRGILGEGSMGRTFLAYDTQTESSVALKQLYPSRLAQWKDLELFRREADILGRLQHPQIPAYLDAFDECIEEQTCYFLVQDFVEGPSLRQKLSAGHRFDVQAVLDLAEGMLDILVYLFERDPPVAHRDIKPENIILRQSDGKPTLVDFGAVREIVRLTMGGGSTIIGTYGYMAPEQLMGCAVPATDLYALGITLIECMTRQMPTDLRGDSTLAHIEGASVSEDLKRFLKRLTAPNQVDRYTSAQQARDDLHWIRHGGALQHARELETAIAKRQKRQAKALRRASSPGIYAGYAFVAIALFAALGFLVSFLFNAMAAANIDLGLQVALGASGVGFALVALLAITRYSYDAWSPPQPNWVRTRGRIVSIDHDYLDREQQVWCVTYAFPYRGGTYRSQLYLPLKTIKEHKKTIGRTFAVYYPPGKPEYNETEDFTILETGETTVNLFDLSAKNSPKL